MSDIEKQNINYRIAHLQNNCKQVTEFNFVKMVNISCHLIFRWLWRCCEIVFYVFYRHWIYSALLTTHIGCMVWCTWFELLRLIGWLVCWCGKEGPSTIDGWFVYSFIHSIDLCFGFLFLVLLDHFKFFFCFFVVFKWRTSISLAITLSLLEPPRSYTYVQFNVVSFVLL